MSDIDCPYCGHSQEVCHDDGFGYKEGINHEMECYECEKNFVFQTCISFDYYPEKADCLNDGEHNFKPTVTFPVSIQKWHVPCAMRKEIAQPMKCAKFALGG